MSNPQITINLVVLNGEKYIRHCLDGILAQTYSHELIEFNILDNGSTDGTIKIITDYGLRINNSQFAIRNSQSRFTLVQPKVNLGMWPGQEELLKHSNGKYVLAMAVDVILEKDFLRKAVEIMEQNSKIGGLEPKIYKYDIVDGRPKFTKTIDTLGFKIEKSRRVTNIGHGEEDKGQYDGLDKIFAVEGAAPFFRREAMEDIRVNGEFCDHDYFWYGDDLDIAWRMNMYGWEQVFAPSVIAWHDRQTTKSLKKHWWDYLSRVSIRRQIPIRKRRLDWRNMRWTIVKNDYTINILKDLPLILFREIAVLGYALFFEQGVLAEIPYFIGRLPKMLRKRKEIMAKAKVSPGEIHKFFK